MLNQITKWSVFVYSLLLMVLGVVGYSMADSIYSLIMGVGIGILLLLCSLMMFMGRKLGLILATFFTLLMAGFFSFRYTVTNNLFPGVLAVLSGGMLIFLLLHLGRWKKR